MKPDKLLKQPAALIAVCVMFGMLAGMALGIPWAGNQPLGLLVGALAGLVIGALIVQSQRRRSG